MKVTLDLDEALIRRAAELTGITTKTALVRLGLESLAATAGPRRLRSPGWSETRVKPQKQRKYRDAGQN